MGNVLCCLAFYLNTTQVTSGENYLLVTHEQNNLRGSHCWILWSCILQTMPPLTDRSTFVGLGLDPLIATHLASKMNISAPTSIQQKALSSLLVALGTELSDRDAFIQSQIGSGKTLSHLLPILQDLLPLSSLSYIEHSIGTLAIIVAPTRELAKQISDVAEQLVLMRLWPKGDSMDDSVSSTCLTQWLVTGLLIGGENKTQEKAQLRKGLPILVSTTPGRLLDHLQNTVSFNVGKCR